LHILIKNIFTKNMAQIFGDFKTLENVTPSDSKVFGFACVSENREKDCWGWTYEIGSFDFIYGYYRGCLIAYEHEKIACMAMFVLGDANVPVGIISSLVLTQEESQGSFYSSEKDAKIVMRDLILSYTDIDITDLEGLCDFNDR